MNKEVKLSRRELIKNSGFIVGGIVTTLGGLEVFKLSDDVTRKMSYRELISAIRDAAVDDSGPLTEPTVSSGEAMLMYGSAYVMAGGVFLIDRGIRNIRRETNKIENDQHFPDEVLHGDNALPEGMIDENFVGPFAESVTVYHK
jgi:hypothetical protein